MIYLDNNGTTVMPKKVIDKMCAWMNKGNPSADYKSARDCCSLMDAFRTFIAASCKFTPVIGHHETQAQSPNSYYVIFTSGASESNSFILRSVVDSYNFNNRTVPHIVVSAVEHKSLLACAEQLALTGRAELSIVRPNALGFVEPSDIDSAIQANTCLVCVMAANNETGCINNIKAIGAVAHKRNVPFYTDAVQTFGKFMIDPIAQNVDAFCASFHKLYGPPGVGLLVVKKKFADGYKMMPQICGTQQDGMRGGTEALHNIAGAFEATKIAWANRAKKNMALAGLKAYFLGRLAKVMPTQNYADYLESIRSAKAAAVPADKFAVVISPCEKIYNPNTIMISIVMLDETKQKNKFCNVEFKKKLQTVGIIVSIGSACNTSSDKASYVLVSMGIPQVLKRGILRISMSDYTTKQDLDGLLSEISKLTIAAPS